MTGTIRRSIDELRTRYELEPAIRDVYVEGDFDCDVLSRRLSDRQESLDVVVYPIDTVEIPSGILRGYGLTTGNRQEVIALARELADLPEVSSFRCIVDRDLDHWLGALEQTARLIWTRYCALELYLFSEEALNEMLIVAARSRIADFAQFIGSLVEVLRRLYAIRLADRELGWAMEWLDSTKHLSARDSQIVFNEPEYSRRLLLKNGRFDRRDDFETRKDAWLTKLVGDPRNYIRGHDLITLLAWAIRAFRGHKELANERFVERLFVLGADRSTELLELIP